MPTGADVRLVHRPRNALIQVPENNQQQPAAEGSSLVDAVTPDSTSDEAFDTFSASSDLSPGGVLAPPQLEGFGEWSEPLSTILCEDASMQAALG